jgi:hypothetical protein
MTALNAPAKRLASLNQRGQSLIDATLSIALVGILTASTAWLLASQSKQLQGLSEAMAGVELGRNLATAMADGSVCNYVVNPANTGVPLTFDATSVSAASPMSFVVPTLYASILPTGQPGPVLATFGTVPSVLANTLVINSIQLVIDNAPNPLPPPGPGATFMGNWLLAADPAKTVRTMPPVHLPVILTVDTTIPTQAAITGCMAGGTGSIVGACPPNQLLIGATANGTPICTKDTGQPCSVTGTTYGGSQGATVTGVAINRAAGRCCVVPDYTTFGGANSHQTLASCPMCSDGTVCIPY